MLTPLLTTKLLLTTYLVKTIPNLIARAYLRHFELDLRTSKSNYLALLLFLKMHSLCQFNLLIDLIVYDIPGKKRRFTIIFLLLSTRYNTRMRVQLQISETQTIYTLTHLFKNAGWLEREAWDMFGVFFLGNKDLRRILTDYGFIGHPLRKDFPLTGFTEIYFSDYYRRIVHKPVEVMQEYRNFIFVSPWSH